MSNENDVGSKHFDESLQLHGTVPLSSDTQQPVDCDVTQLTDDIAAHLPTLRATYLQVAPVTPLALIRSRCACLFSYWWTVGLCYESSYKTNNCCSISLPSVAYSYLAWYYCADIQLCAAYEKLGLLILSLLDFVKVFNVAWTQIGHFVTGCEALDSE